MIHLVLAFVLKFVLIACIVTAFANFWQYMESRERLFSVIFCVLATLAVFI